MGARRSTGRYAALIAIAIAGCFDPKPEAGAPCSAEGTCPEGLSCIGGLCQEMGTVTHECDGAPEGTACGDPSSSECDQPDTCSAGACVVNHAPAGGTCGPAATSDCATGNVCNAAGACVAGVPPEGAVCYDCAAGPGLCNGCDASQTCTDTSCAPNVLAGVLDPGAPGGNSENGIMFDVTAATDLTVTSFDVNFSAAGATTFQVYYRAGTHVGHEATAGDWTMVGSSAVTANALGTPTPIPIAVNVAIPAGQRYAFYLTNDATTFRVSYHNGTGVGAISASDAAATVYEGTGVDWGTAGFGATYKPRVWEGRMHYTSDVTSLATTAAGDTSSDGVMFDVAAQATVRTSGLAVELAPGSYAVDVYFRRGSHVGFAGAATGWQQLASGVAVTSAGAGKLTPLPVALGVQIAAGSTAAFYITKGIGADAVVATTGTTVGTPAATNADLAVDQGVLVSDSFGGAGTVVAPRVSVSYATCQ